MTYHDIRRPLLGRPIETLRCAESDMERGKQVRMLLSLFL